MNNSDLEHIKKIILKADRDVLELLLYSIMQDWSYEKAITLTSAAVVRSRISDLERIKFGNIYKGISNKSLRLVKDSGHTAINERIDDLKRDLERYQRRYEKACKPQPKTEQ